MDITLQNITRQIFLEILLSFGITRKEAILKLFDRGTALISNKKCLICSILNNIKIVYCIDIDSYGDSLSNASWIDIYKKNILYKAAQLASNDQDDNESAINDCLHPMQILASIADFLIDPSISRYSIIDNQLYDNQISQFILISKNIEIEPQNQYSNYSEYAFSMSGCRGSLSYDDKHIYAANYGISHVSILSDIISINDYAFSNCANLSSVDFYQARISSIGIAAFSDTPLQSLKLPTTLSIISEHAFEHTSIQKLTIPASVISIEHDAFEACYDLSVLEIDNNDALTIDEDAFEDCMSLQIVEIKNYAAQNTILLPSVFSNCINLQYVIFSKGISVAAFNNYYFNGQIIHYMYVLPDDNYADVEKQLQDDKKIDDLHTYFMKKSNMKQI